MALYHGTEVILNDLVIRNNTSTGGGGGLWAGGAAWALRIAEGKVHKVSRLVRQAAPRHPQMLQALRSQGQREGA